MKSPATLLWWPEAVGDLISQPIFAVPPSPSPPMLGMAEQCRGHAQWVSSPATPRSQKRSRSHGLLTALKLRWDTSVCDQKNSLKIRQVLQCSQHSHQKCSVWAESWSWPQAAAGALLRALLSREGSHLPPVLRAYRVFQLMVGWDGHDVFLRSQNNQWINGVFRVSQPMLLWVKRYYS